MPTELLSGTKMLPFLGQASRGKAAMRAEFIALGAGKVGCNEHNRIVGKYFFNLRTDI